MTASLAWSRGGSWYPDEKETWCLESKKNWSSELCFFFFLTHSGNTVGEGKEGRMLSGEAWCVEKRTSEWGEGGKGATQPTVHNDKPQDPRS